MSGLSNKGSYVRALCMNIVTDYRFLYKKRCIFSKSCGFLARLKGVIVLKGMFSRRMGQYFFFVRCFLLYRFCIVCDIS